MDFLKTRPDLAGYDTSKIKPQMSEEIVEVEPAKENPFKKRVEPKAASECRLDRPVDTSKDAYGFENENWVRLSGVFPKGGAGPSPLSKTRKTRAFSNGRQQAKEWAEKYREGEVDSTLGGTEESGYLNGEYNAFQDGSDTQIKVRSCLIQRTDVPKTSQKRFGFAVFGRYDFTREAPRTSGRFGRGSYVATWRDKSTAARAVPWPVETCQAPEGQPCITESGERSPNSHKDRVMVYVISTEGLDEWFDEYEARRYTTTYDSAKRKRLEKEYGEDKDE